MIYLPESEGFIATDAHDATITANPPRGLWPAKNAQDHAALSAIWTRKKVIAVPLDSLGANVRHEKRRRPS